MKKLSALLFTVLLFALSVQGATALPPAMPEHVEDFESAYPLQFDPTYGPYLASANFTRMQIVADPLDPANKVFKCTVYPDDFKNKGERCEFFWHTIDPAASQRVYEWRFMIPAGYIDSTPDKWQHIAQWHDYPENGDWSTFPANSPPISFDYLNMPVVDLPPGIPEALTAQYPNWQSLAVAGNISLVSVTVGVTVPKPIIAVFPVVKEQWQDMMVDIKWSHDDEGGFVKVYHRGKLIGQHTGRNMLNDFPHFPNWGLYRHKDIQTVNSILFDDIKINALTP